MINYQNLNNKINKVFADYGAMFGTELQQRIQNSVADFFTDLQSELKDMQIFTDEIEVQETKPTQAKAQSVPRFIQEHRRKNNQK